MREEQSGPFRRGAQFVLRRLDKALWSGRGLSAALYRERRPTKDLFSTGPLEGAGIYSVEAKGPWAGLTKAELALFQKDGWIGPFDLFDPAGVRAACEVHDRVRREFTFSADGDLSDPEFFLKHPWQKSAHAYIPEFYDIARHPAIVERVASILGADLMAWGFSMNHYYPGNVHRWHVDIEHRKWKGVTVFLGMKNITLESTLKVITGSHRMGRMPQALGLCDDQAALAACREQDQGARLVWTPVEEGKFIVFDGLLWHGSRNEGFRTRDAIIIQYSRPDQKVEVPMTFDEPIQWHPSPVPCVLVKGEDRWRVNRLVGRPG